MRLSISNIAWDVSEDHRVAEILQEHRVDAIDIAPGKYFPDPATARHSDIEKVRLWWADRGIDIIGMQALLFGTTGLNVFGSDTAQDALLKHMTAVCRIGSSLGATRLVFGSPKNRDRRGLSDEQAVARGAEFFRRLGDIALAAGVMICLEPNPACYGANFMTSSGETAHVVRITNHPAIGMQLDTGAVAINGESIEAVLAECAPLIRHVHISEPNLVPVGDGQTDHGAFHEAMMKYIPDHAVSIEMLATRHEPHCAAIRRAISCATAYYRPILGTSI
ncbi:sugar phosphate isomerase/epimerase family protein [Bordetella genomosp. 9]|uniref:Xylose isomerase n=1 Tax=Bordetella genomosp. 9 TaxID=1416803 RepID=A0A1W6Z4P8_9BORD|nr:TIM barrel protein [Bordetella genomosp. 9]ARP88266.1 xylose isomerase [Bordetella genomosp. 9]